METSYNIPLVVFSVFIAVLASYTSLELTERITARGKIKIGWLVGSSITMGTGIWSMHFVGMLAYSISVSINYNLAIVVVSWIPAVLASGVAFYYLHQGFSNRLSLIKAGALMGAGIGAMHYIGMAAMVVQANMNYDYSIVVISVIFAVILSTISLATANYIKKFLDREELKLGGSYLMGTAISGMHYIGMAAIGFTAMQDTSVTDTVQDNSSLAYTIGLTTIIIIGGAFMACLRAQKQDLQIMAEKLQKSAVLEKVNEELEKRVGERTAELRQAKEAVILQNAQLKTAKEAAEAASKSKDIFLANISHELRTPLNSILGYAKILQRDTNLTSNQIEDLGIVQQSGVHLLTLINDILDFSKNNAAKMELHPTEIEVKSFLDGIMKIAQMWAKEKELPLKLKTDNKLPHNITADEKRVRQVIINLLSNAVKFTPSGEVILKITVLENIDGELGKISQQKLRFEVIDTGVGINPEKLDKIFQPFEQVGDIPSRGVGTGLGLSIAQQLVKLMGSELKVKSKLGNGSTFWFDVIFPVTIEKFVTSPPKQIQTETKRIFGYQGTRRRVLVVDDKKENRDLLVKILQPIGFEIETANDGQQMLEMAAFMKPDMILLDLFMPVKTGFTSAKELRKKSGFKDVPIIVITASSITIEMGNYLDCEAVLHKPVDEEELLSNMQKYLNLKWIYHKVS